MSVSCKVCGEVFKTSVLLIRHRRYQSQKCNEYKIQYNCLSGVLIAFLSKNSTFTDVKCSRCVKIFSSRKHMLVHMRTHTKSAPYKCDFCSKTFILMIHLYYHLDSHRGEKSNVKKCMKCQNKFQELLKKLNFNSSTIRAIRCRFCSKKKFSNVIQLMFHLRMTHRLQMSVCSDCGRKSITFQDIVSYLKNRSALIHSKDKQSADAIIHSKGKQSADAIIQSKGKQSNLADANPAKRYHCESCGQIFEKIHLLEIHLLSHISDPLFCCRGCQEVFRNGQLYVMHIMKCIQKKKTLSSSAKFVADHFTTVSNESFDCPYCTLCFASSSQLQTHLPYHVDVKDSRSDTESADEEFIVKDRSDTETNSDQNRVRTFVCLNCNKAFKKNEDLTVHVKTGCPQTYSCRLCSKIFSCSSDHENHIRNHHGRELHERARPYSKPFNLDDQCYKSFANNASVSSRAKLLLPDGALPSSGIDTDKISNNCESAYFSSPTDPKHCKKDDNYKSSLEEHFLCDVCGEVFSALVDLNNHMNEHNPQVCDRIGTMPSMHHSRQPDIYHSQPSWMMIRPPENLPYFIPNNTRRDHYFSSGPDMNPYSTRIESITPISHRIGFPFVQQANNLTMPTFSSANGIPFVPSVNELKSFPYPESVLPVFPFHLQNSRGNFFPASNLDNQSSMPNLPHDECRDNLTTDNNRLNAFYSVPPHGNFSLANNNGKNSNLERSVSLSPILGEKRNTFFSRFTPPQNNENVETVTQKTNADISRSASDYELNTSFILERGNFVSNISPRNGTSFDNNGASSPVSFSQSKCSNLTSTNQDDLTESSPTVRLKTHSSNMETQYMGYPAVNELGTMPNISQDQRLPEIKPLNLCQTRNLQSGKFYNYSSDQEFKGFDHQQSLLTNFPMNVQTPYPVPSFWEESKSGLDFDFGGNQCPTSENESSMQFNSSFQIESIPPPLWIEPDYDMNLKQFRDPNSRQVDDKLVKIRNNSTYQEDHNGNVDCLYDN